MIQKTKMILKDLEKKIEFTWSSENQPLAKAQQSHELAKTAINQAKEILVSSNFDSKTDEIEYFKYVQPEIISYALFYCLQHKYFQKVDSICSVKQIKNYCKNNIKLIDVYIIENQTFITNYKSSSSVLDNFYFVRNKSENSFLLDECLAFVESSCSTGYDIIAARYLAYIKLRRFYEYEILQLKLKLKSPYIGNIGENHNKITWTDKKAGLIELVYALHEAGCINNGKSKLDEIAKAIEIGFNVQLENIYSAFKEIFERKNPTQYLDLLKDRLLSKIERKYK